MKSTTFPCAGGAGGGRVERYDTLEARGLQDYKNIPGMFQEYFGLIYKTRSIWHNSFDSGTGGGKGGGGTKHVPHQPIKTNIFSAWLVGGVAAGVWGGCRWDGGGRGGSNNMRK